VAAAVLTGTVLIAAARGDELTGYLLLGIILVAVSLIIVATRRRAADRAGSPREYAREQIARLREEHAVKSDMESLLVQLTELSREINAQIDTRFAKLEQAIADADERIAALEALLRRAAGIENVDVVVTDDGVSETETKRPESIEAEPADPRYTRIYELADQGLSAVEIAQQVGQTAGEVELILNLRRGKRP